MSSAHEDGARSAFLRSLKSRGPELTYRDIEQARETAWCRDPAHGCRTISLALGDPYGGHESLEQLWARARIGHWFATGVVRLATFEIDEHAAIDQEWEENQAVLERSLGDGFDVRIHDSTGGRDNDGSISWKHELRVVRQGDSAEAAKGDVTQLLPFVAPIEIGYTHASRTMLHLAEAGAVWRWPYGSDQIWLLAAVEPDAAVSPFRPIAHQVMAALDFD